MKRRQAGQGLVEYALILVLVAIVVIAILLLLGPIIRIPSDVAITKEASSLDDGLPILAGRPMRYTLHISVPIAEQSWGASNVEVVDTLPDGHTYVEFQATWGKRPLLDACSLAGNTVTCIIPMLHPIVCLSPPCENEARIEIYALAPSEPGVINNTASASTGRPGGWYDPNPDNNVAWTSVTVLPNPGLPVGETIMGGVATDTSSAFLEMARGEADGTGDADDVQQKIDAFMEQARQQSESLRESAILLKEAFDEALEILIEHADEMGDEVFSDQLHTLQQDVASGDLDAVVSVLSTLGPRFAQVLQSVQAALILKMEPLLIDACWTLDGAQVPPDTLNEAIEALEQMEEEDPGSTGDVIPIMWEWWDQVESRNLVIEESAPVLASGVELGITWLQNSGDQALIDLAAGFEAQSAGCGD